MVRNRVLIKKILVISVKMYLWMIFIKADKIYILWGIQARWVAGDSESITH